jgi:hypothetical protein
MTAKGQRGYDPQRYLENEQCTEQSVAGSLARPHYPGTPVGNTRKRQGSRSRPIGFSICEFAGQAPRCVSWHFWILRHEAIEFLLMEWATRCSNTDRPSVALQYALLVACIFSMSATDPEMLSA